MGTATHGAWHPGDAGVDEQTAWREYLAFVQASIGAEYDAAEELAWSRLVRTLDELSAARAQRELAEALERYG